jgi:Uma2 family endonuclease
MSLRLTGRQLPSGELFRRHRISVSAYQQMGRAGIFTPEDRVELIEGAIIDMAPIGSRHGGKVTMLCEMLIRATGPRAIVAVQNPITLGDYSEAQPDIAVLRRREDFYTGAHPGPEDVYLLIEVADTTLAYDREVKVPLYARHGVREVWLLDLQDGQLTVFQEPVAVGYLQMASYRSGNVAPQWLPDLTIDVARLLA